MIELKEPITERNFLPPGRYFTVKEYAKMRNLSESSVRSAISRGTIQGYFYCGIRVIREESGADRKSEI